MAKRRYSIRCMAHPDLNRLIDGVLNFPHIMLKEHGEFYPFGHTRAHDGTVTAYGVDTGGERQPSRQVIDTLSRVYRRKVDAGEVHAVAVCLDVRVIPPDQQEKT